MEDFNRSFLELRLDLKSPELELELELKSLELELELELKLIVSSGIGIGIENHGIGIELKKWNWPQPCSQDIMASAPEGLNLSYYCQVSNIRRTKSQQLKDSRTALGLSLPNPLKPDVKSRKKM